MRESEGGEYNGEAGWEKVDRDFRIRSRNRCLSVGGHNDWWLRSFSATRTTFGRWRAWCPVGDTPPDSTWERTTLRFNTTFYRLTVKSYLSAKSQFGLKVTLTAFFYKPHIICESQCLPPDLHGSCHYRSDGRERIQSWHGEQHKTPKLSHTINQTDISIALSNNGSLQVSNIHMEGEDLVWEG